MTSRYLIAGHVGWVYLGWLISMVSQEQGGVGDQLQLGVAGQDLEGRCLSLFRASVHS